LRQDDDLACALCQTKKKKTVARREYTKDESEDAEGAPKSKMRIAKLSKRSGATLRQKARAMDCRSAIADK
jgi:hypothetical protein